MSKRKRTQNNSSKQKTNKTNAMAGIPPGFGNRVEPGLGALVVSLLQVLSLHLFLFSFSLQNTCYCFPDHVVESDHLSLLGLYVKSPSTQGSDYFLSFGINSKLPGDRLSQTGWKGPRFMSYRKLRLKPSRWEGLPPKEMLGRQLNRCSLQMP